MTAPVDLHALLVTLLTEHQERLSENELAAFEDMLSSGFRFSTPRQTQWILATAERLGVWTRPSENIFSKMDPEKQARQRAAAAKVKLPWEK
jgi:hypothetical protein